MSKKISKDEAKRPDAMTQELKKGFEWSAKHLNLVIGLSVLFVATGGAVTVIKHFAQKKEAEVQEKYFVFEKQYLDKKQAFEMAESKTNTKPEPDAKPKKDKKGTEAKPETNPETAKPEEIASGDLVKDYGSVVDGFKSVIASNKSTNGAKMAALHLSEIYSKYAKSDESITVLKDVDSSDSDLVSGLVKMQLGNALAEKNDCSQAIKVWDEVINKKHNEFLTPSIHLKKALCYEALNDKAKAEEFYKMVKDADKNPKAEAPGNTALAKTADKYLRLLKNKAN